MSWLFAFFYPTSAARIDLRATFGVFWLCSKSARPECSREQRGSTSLRLAAGNCQVIPTERSAGEAVFCVIAALFSDLLNWPRSRRRAEQFVEFGIPLRRFRDRLERQAPVGVNAGNRIRLQPRVSYPLSMPRWPYCAASFTVRSLCLERADHCLHEQLLVIQRLVVIGVAVLPIALTAFSNSALKVSCRLARGRTTLASHGSPARPIRMRWLPHGRCSRSPDPDRP